MEKEIDIRKKEIHEHNLIWYNKVHDSLIERGKLRGLNKKKLKESGDNNYYHKHHIIPKCMGGEDKKENYVLLTFREHIIIHKLLAILYPEETKLKYAVFVLMNIFITNPLTGEKEQYKFSSSREAEYYYSLCNGFRGENNPNFGKHHSNETKKILSEKKKGIPIGPFTEDHKKRIGESNLGKRKGFRDSEETKLKKSISHLGEKNYNFGKRKSEEVKRKISETKKLNKDSVKEKNPFFGKKHTEESRKKMSEAQKRNSKLISERNGKKVISPDGRLFNSMTEASKIIGITLGTLRNWIKNKPEKGWKYY